MSFPYFGPKKASLALNFMRFLLSINLKLPVVVCAEVGKVAEWGRIRRPDEKSHYFVQY